MSIHKVRKQRNPQGKDKQTHLAAMRRKVGLHYGAVARSVFCPRLAEALQESTSAAKLQADNAAANEVVRTQSWCQLGAETAPSWQEICFAMALVAAGVPKHSPLDSAGPCAKPVQPSRCPRQAAASAASRLSH